MYLLPFSLYSLGTSVICAGCEGHFIKSECEADNLKVKTNIILQVPPTSFQAGLLGTFAPFSLWQQCLLCPSSLSSVCIKFTCQGFRAEFLSYDGYCVCGLRRLFTSYIFIAISLDIFQSKYIVDKYSGCSEISI